ncbi:MAG: hypothetical protein F6J92_21430 [Symploca sp. SIO1A3]|nr:hypothetical protein [Symploca sp. SIO1A3]
MSGYTDLTNCRGHWKHFGDHPSANYNIGDPEELPYPQLNLLDYPSDTALTVNINSEERSNQVLRVVHAIACGGSEANRKLP